MIAKTFQTVTSIVVVLALVLLQGVAHADEKLPTPAASEAKGYLDAGNKAYRSAQSKTDPEEQRRDYEDAIKQYRAGAAIETKVIFTFYWNLGHSYRQLGEYTQAEWFYKKFLEFSPRELRLHRAAADDFITRMRAELNKEATLAGPTDPAPAPIREVVRPGAASDGNGPTAPKRDARSWHSDRWGWVLVGGGLVGAAVGGGLVLSGRSLHNQAGDEDRQSVRADVADQARGRVLLGGIAAGVGVAIIATGLFKLAMTDNTDTGVQLSVGPSGFDIRGSF